MKHIYRKVLQTKKQFTKLKKRLYTHIKEESTSKLSHYRVQRLIRRYNIFAKRLKLAGMSTGLMTILLTANPMNTNAQVAYEACDPNPFASVIVDNDDDYIDIGFGDVDGDGDLDMVYGEYYGEIRYYQNNGDGTFTQQTGANNPFDAIIAEAANGGDDYVGYYATPTFADLDGDGDMDLIFGAYYIADYDYGFFYYENNGGVFTELTGAANPLDGVVPGETYSAPTFADIDGDGDLDLIVTTEDTPIQFFENVGGTFTEQTGASNPFDAISPPGTEDTPKTTFSDVDGDGDLDLLLAYGNATNTDLYYYENIAGVYTLQTGANDPFDFIQINTSSTFYPWITPVFADIDGDGVDELYISVHSLDGGDDGVLSFCPPGAACDDADNGAWISN